MTLKDVVGVLDIPTVLVDPPCCCGGPTPSGCCSQGIAGFQGTGQYYLTAQIDVDEVVDCSGCTPDISGGNHYTRVASVLEDPGCCCSTCGSASGTSDCASCGPAESPCHKTYGCVSGAGCSSPIGGGCSDWDDSSGLTCYGLYDNLGLGWCCTPIFTVSSDTVKSGTCNCTLFSGCCTSTTVTITITLSDPCVGVGGLPPTYACCPYAEVCCPPPPTTGMCCLPDCGCSEGVTHAACTAAGGTDWFEGETCSFFVDCCASQPACFGACCFGTDCFDCYNSADCVGGGGTFQGLGSNCGSVSCV